LGLLAHLEYQTKTAGRLQRAVQVAVSNRRVARVLSTTLAPIDRALYGATRGRTTVAGLLAGIPIVMLSTTGARSGKTRTMPLLGIPIAGDLAVIGSNFAQSNTPGWAHNLAKNPAAVVAHRGRSIAVVARRADPSEAEQVWTSAAAIYRAFPKYRSRVVRREIPVFVLERST
jgi:deazaflavin-dependent oxidoreductase (nitroreductase family)